MPSKARHKDEAVPRKLSARFSSDRRVHKRVIKRKNMGNRLTLQITHNAREEGYKINFSDGSQADYLIINGPTPIPGFFLREDLYDAARKVARDFYQMRGYAPGMINLEAHIKTLNYGILTQIDVNF